jgi:hypothetical protein
MSRRLTDLQRSVLCWLEATEGVIPTKEGLFARNAELGHEILSSLRVLDLVSAPEWTKEGRRVTLTEEGIEIAKATRYGSCPSCVQVFCVCRVRLVCASGCGSAGCHGSHD